MMEGVHGRARTLTGAILGAIVLAALPGCGWALKNQRLTELETQVGQLQDRLVERENDQRDLLASLDKLRGQVAQLQESQARQAEEQTREAESYARELQLLKEQQEKALEGLEQRKSAESQELLQAQQKLTESLQKELGDARAKLEMTQRGLVLTLLDEIFFDSGQAVIKTEGFDTLDKVGQVLKETVPNLPMAVEGHTDNLPIKHSSWRSNWELSSSRALAVVHYLIDRQGLEPNRVRAVGFGEFHPVASNDLPQGRRQNRRVELVILPEDLRKERE